MSKGSKQRPTDGAKYSENWDRIFNKDKKDLRYESDNPLERPYEPEDVNETSKEERPRESIRHQYSESDKLAERQNSDFQKGSVRYIEHSVQYYPPSENNR